MNMRSHRARDASKAGGWLHLAATPAFAAMAMITVVAGNDPAHMLCQAMGHGWLSPDSMAFMYLLMAIFHAAPWWERIAMRTRGRAHAQTICASGTTTAEPR